MQTTKEPGYSASSPLFILDSDMSGPAELNLELDFFDSNLALENATSPGIFLGEDLTAGTNQYLANLGSSSATHKGPRFEQPSLLDSNLKQTPSARSTASPAFSAYLDSSSDSSRYKRKSSSGSSHSSTMNSGDALMMDADPEWFIENMGEGERETTYTDYNGTINPAEMNPNFEFNDKFMENDFDFESASSSPSMFGNNGMGDVESPEVPTAKPEPARKRSPMAKKNMRNHSKAASQHSVTQAMKRLTTTGSSEQSPLIGGMMYSQESSPKNMFNPSPSPGVGQGIFDGNMVNPNPANPIALGSQYFAKHGMLPPTWTLYSPPYTRVPMLNLLGMGTPRRPVLTTHPIPFKSRVETQIPIRLTIFPLPVGVYKLHLPTHTISKPKLLAKPTPGPSRDTVRLETMLVCSSAMQDPRKRQLAYVRAQGSAANQEPSPPESTQEDENDEKPSNGGEVKICQGCIVRERKRAARKKVKKVEEEDTWHQYEAKRVVVFNTAEIKELVVPGTQTPHPTEAAEKQPDAPAPYIPQGALEVDIPMRIACYCRHQNEKLGFQVIFTIKDWQGRLVAQAMSQSIMITDDHKTHNMPSVTPEVMAGPDVQMYGAPGLVPNDANFDISALPPVPRFAPSGSSSDLQSLQQDMSAQYPLTTSPATSNQPSQGTSATMTPRNMSRQTSPTLSSGPSKKRKASGTPKVPSGLAMTRLETGQAVNPSQGGSTSATPSSAHSPFTPNAFQFNDQLFNGLPSSQIPTQFRTGPPTPNNNDQLNLSNANRSHSMENLAVHSMYSAPSSAHPSRAPSPNSVRNSMQSNQHQAQLAQQALANGLYSVPMTLNPINPPVIRKLIPNEGPKAGGIEVTCLGSGFFQGLDVMFGDTKATTTTYWGDTSLVCLLPPSAFAGVVPISFAHERPAYPMATPTKPFIYFKYVDDDDAQIIEAALTVLGHKMTGRVEDARDLARRICNGNDGVSWPAPVNPSSSSGQQQHISGFNMASSGYDLEATLLKVLDLIDLDDSPNMPRLNLRKSSGQTMLHLACSLGLHRFVAALLARGANPEPRDKGGFTPMHFAALHNHPQIVRRLMLSGADPTLRSLQGYTPADLATSGEVLRATRRLERHKRNRSAGSSHSRTSSARSLRSLWESEPVAPVDRSDSDENSDEEDDADSDEGGFWMRSRRPSAHKAMAETVEDAKDPVVELPNIGPAAGLTSPTAAMVAFRIQLAAQIQHLQQTMHLNLPHLPNLPQMPQMPTLANLPDYQAYLPTARRISSLVGNNRPNSPKEQDYKWWDLFSSNIPSAPPAYEDIFPEGDVDTKRASATQAAADTVADNKCAELFDQQEVQERKIAEAESSTTGEKRGKEVLIGTVRIGQNSVITKEQHEALRRAHAQKYKRVGSDRKLFMFWIPILILILAAMLYHRVPKAWTLVTTTFQSIQNYRASSTTTGSIEVP